MKVKAIPIVVFSAVIPLSVIITVGLAFNTDTTGTTTTPASVTTKMGAFLSGSIPTNGIVQELLKRDGLADMKAHHDKVSSLGLMVRRGEVYWAATRLFADYKIVQLRCDQIDDSSEGEQRKDQLWNEAHQRNAVFLYHKMVTLEALWIKLGQYLSSRADIMPEPYLKVLSKCQDSLPARPFDEITRQIEEELGRPISAVFQSIEDAPLAVASIASVYRAVLLDGRKVVIKVQHETVAGRLLQDLQNLEVIGDTVRYLEPDFDWSPAVREWASEVPKELDFRQEAENMQRVQKNLEPLFMIDSPLCINVKLAEVIPGLVTKRILVMSYIDGFKVDHKASLDQFEINRELIVRDITRSYANQIFVDGFYSGDPHPGNILVESVSKLPVLLDFGLTKQLTDDIRFNFSKMIVAATEQDIYGLLQALDGVGLKLRTEVPFDIAFLVKYFFRDAKPAEAAQAESKQRRDEFKKKKEMAAKSLYIGDKVEVSKRNILGIRSVRNAEIIGVDGDNLSVRFTGGDESVVSRSQAKLQKTRSPIDAWPDAFIFFERVLGLLRGLTASLDVNQSYLEVMTPYARKALVEHYRQNAPSLGGDALPHENIDAVGGHVLELVNGLVRTGDILGAQVYCIKDGKTVVDICGGVMDPYERRPVTPNTVFNTFSVTKAVTAACIHLLAEDGLIDFNDPVAKYWPEFGKNNKSEITISHVLNHQAGLANAALDEIASDPFLVCDAEFMTTLMADATPEHAPGEMTKYHYLSFGWILDGLVRAVTGTNTAEFVERRIADKLGIDRREFMIGRVALTEDNDMPKAELVLKMNRVAPPAPPGGTSSSTPAGTSTRRPIDAPSLLMNPTFFNNPRVRGSVIAAANGHFSARSLALFYQSLLPTPVDAGQRQLFPSLGGQGIDIVRHAGASDSPVTTQAEPMLQGEEGMFLNGFTLFPTVEERQKSPLMMRSEAAFGHAGVGGSLAYCDKKSGLVVVVLVNRLSFDVASTKAIVSTLHSALNLAVPARFQMTA